MKAISFVDSSGLVAVMVVVAMMATGPPLSSWSRGGRGWRSRPLWFQRRGGPRRNSSHAR
eukprot:scaffold4372_cov397-Prasinococcus_capsulatus_cf.AAC.7